MPFRTAKYCCYVGVTLFFVAGLVFVGGLFTNSILTMVSAFPHPQVTDHDLILMQNQVNLIWASAKVLCVLAGVAISCAALYAFAEYSAPYSTGAKDIDAAVEPEPKKQK